MQVPMSSIDMFALKKFVRVNAPMVWNSLSFNCIYRRSHSMLLNGFWTLIYSLLHILVAYPVIVIQRLWFWFTREVGRVNDCIVLYCRSNVVVYAVFIVLYCRSNVVVYAVFTAHILAYTAQNFILANHEDLQPHRHAANPGTNLPTPGG